jgi:hypothetical protein
MAERWTPTLRLHVRADRCHLWLGEVAHGEGESLQVALDGMVEALRTLALGIHRSAQPMPYDLARAEPRLLPFLWEIGNLAACGEDIRGRVLDPPAV